MKKKSESLKPFFVKNCSLVVLATGERAASLIELIDTLATVDVDCLYYHFWGRRLHPQFTYPEFHNDFAAWAHQNLHDDFLAERLGIIDPIEYKSLEDLRLGMLNILKQRLKECKSDILLNARQFHFKRSVICVFETPDRILHPKDLLKGIKNMSPDSVFYHFIDARRRTPDGTNDFCEWLKIFGEKYHHLIEKIDRIDPYFLTLQELKIELIKAVKGVK